MVSRLTPWVDRRETRPTPAPLPVAGDRSNAPYYVIMRPFQHPYEEKQTTVYVKEGEFFRAQGGLTEPWGAQWIGIVATSLNDARLKCHAAQGTACPTWHLEDQRE